MVTLARYNNTQVIDIVEYLLVAQPLLYMKDKHVWLSILDKFENEGSVLGGQNSMLFEGMAHIIITNTIPWSAHCIMYADHDIKMFEH